MAASNVLIVGMRGLGIEIGKTYPLFGLSAGFRPHADTIPLIYSKEHLPGWRQELDHLRSSTGPA